MPTWATYRGLTVPSSTTGDAGGYLKGDLTALSDRDRLIAPVKVAALSNVASLSGPQTVGGVSLVAGDRVLLTAQTTASQNGPWVVQSGAWTRPDDTPAGTGLAGALVFSQNGVSGAYAANSAWLCTNSPGSDIIGTNSLTFARVTGLALATASSPLSITNDTLSLNGVVPVANGGTGSSTALSSNRIIVSSGGTYAEAAALTNGQLLIGSTGAAPVAASLTGTTNQITVTGGAGTPRWPRARDSPLDHDASHPDGGSQSLQTAPRSPPGSWPLLIQPLPATAHPCPPSPPPSTPPAPRRRAPRPRPSIINNTCIPHRTDRLTSSSHPRPPGGPRPVPIATSLSLSGCLATQNPDSPTDELPRNLAHEERKQDGSGSLPKRPVT
jgi:hypothetical protein